MAVLISSWILLATIACIYQAWRWSRRTMEKSADLIPGPRPWPIIGNILDIGTNTIDFYNNVYRLSTEYPIYRIWMGPDLYFVIHDPDDLEILLSNTKLNEKAMLYDFLHPWLGTGLLTSTGEKWHKHRKLITPTFHFKILEQFLQSFKSKAEILIKQLQKEVDGPSFDIYKYMTLYTLDTITDTAMGLDISAQTDTTSRYVAAVKEIGIIVMTRIMNLMHYSNFIFNLSTPGRRQRKIIGILHDTTNKMINKKKKERKSCNKNLNSQNPEESEIGIKKRVAFLDLLLQKKDEDDLFTDVHLREEVDTFMFEGHDTTSSCLSFALYLLSKHPDVQEKAYAEVKTHISKSEAPTTQMLNELKYLECAIKETLRLYPSVPMLGRKIPEDIKITNNRILLANSSLAIPIYMIHRHPKHFPDPETFNPDRFLPERTVGQHPFAFIPFSAGSRNCIGQKFAMLEIKLAIAEILMHYKLLPDKDFQPILSAELILKSCNGIKLLITSRES